MHSEPHSIRTAMFRKMSFIVHFRARGLFREIEMKNMSADRRMIKIAMAAPYLARQEEHDLATRWKDHDDRARAIRSPWPICAS